MKTFLYVLSICCLLTACDHKELCYHHPHDHELKVLFDWSNLPPADVPSVVKVIFQPASVDAENQHIEFDLPPQGGTVSLPDGHYEVLAFNCESPVNRVEQYSFSMPEGYDSRLWRFVFTTPYSDQLTYTYHAPDFFCLARDTKQLDISTSNRTIVLGPVRKTAHVVCRVRGLSGVPRAERVYGVLTGCAAHLDLFSGVSLERIMDRRQSRIVFPLESVNGTLCARFNVLGCGYAPKAVSSAAHEHLLEIYRVNAEGQWRKLTANVTAQVPCYNPLSVAPPDFNIEVELTDEKPETGDNEGSMFEPDVDDWDDIETDIPLNRI